VLTAALAIVILLPSNITIINAQQPPPSSQPAVNQNQPSSPMFQSTEDSFRVRVPEGWVVRDVHNTGFMLLSEVLQGYGVLAQLCPEEQEQAAPGASSDTCQASQGDIIHIVRYPNLGARLGITPDDIMANSNDTLDDILSYEIQKLQEVGYRDIKIINSSYTTVNFDINTVPAAKVPGKLVEMTYTTNFAPDEIKKGYFISTATDATPHNLGTITGYSIFYEGSSAANIVTSDSLSPTTALLPPVRQVFDSFELIPTEEVTPEAAQTDQTQETDENNDDDDENNNDENNNDENNNDENNNDENNNDENNNNNDCIVVGRPQSSASDNCDETADDNGNDNRSFNDDDGGNGNNNDCIVVGRPQSSASDNCDETAD
jgi:hypothetical protein